MRALELLINSPFVIVAFALPLAAQTIGDFQLPPKTLFDKTMPRYPNAWFYVDAAMAPTYKQAVDFVTQRLRNAMHLPEYFPPFDNPEACDFEVRVEHLQPWIERAQRQFQHAHAFHMRYYYSALAAAGSGTVKLTRGGRTRTFYRFAASVHYEVEHANPHHADVEACPICGRTGEYSTVKGNLVEQVHDPLGLELLLNGTIRGAVVHAEDWEKRRFGNVKDIAGGARVITFEFSGNSGDRNTAKLGIVVIERR
jgi:hypothetical protein